MSPKEFLDTEFNMRQDDGSEWKISLRTLLEYAHGEGAIGIPEWIGDDYSGSHDGAYEDFAKQMQGRYR